jgi:hypothetical protein
MSAEHLQADYQTHGGPLPGMLRRVLIALAAAGVAAVLAAWAADQGQAKHCRSCQVGGRLTLDVQSTPHLESWNSSYVTVAATGRVSSKQRLCRTRGAPELWLRDSRGNQDPRDGARRNSPAGTYSFEAEFSIQFPDGPTDKKDFPPGSMVEYWVVIPSHQEHSIIIGSPTYHCKRLESPHVFVPVPTPPPPPA